MKQAKAHEKPIIIKKPVLIELPVQYRDRLQKLADRERRSVKAQTELLVMQTLDAINSAASA
jgi:hypothetical protein